MDTKIFRLVLNDAGRIQIGDKTDIGLVTDIVLTDMMVTLNSELVHVVNIYVEDKVWAIIPYHTVAMMVVGLLDEE